MEEDFIKSIKQNKAKGKVKKIYIYYEMKKTIKLFLGIINILQNKRSYFYRFVLFFISNTNTSRCSFWKINITDLNFFY